MSQFILLLHSDPSGWSKLSPEEMQRALEKFMGWMQKPFTVGGKRLANDGGRVMRADGGKLRTTDGPYSESKEVLGGFYIIEAASYEEAVERTRDHPTLEYGGTVEVRKIWEE
ncbi:MAG TPA: YciI family protein [Bryobacteraceae bacterium]|nr:YciI family protein [Bryobacteraceae bacterium]